MRAVGSMSPVSRTCGQDVAAKAPSVVVMTSSLIEAHGLTRSFGSVQAVQGVDLDVAEGELVAFLGPNGAGKSTTLRMLTTLLAPTSGTATVAGCDIATDPAGVRHRIANVGQ